MKRFLALFLCVVLWSAPVLATDTTDTADEASTGSGNEGGIDVSAPSAILMEASTGQIIYEKDADSVRPPASVTKVMTLLLIFDALGEGRISLEDEVTTSEYAASMGGSQVFLEPGEVQTVDTMIKCISVASANDACASFKNRSRPKAFVNFGAACFYVHRIICYLASNSCALLVRGYSAAWQYGRSCLLPGRLQYLLSKRWPTGR